MKAHRQRSVALFWGLLPTVLLSLLAGTTTHADPPERPVQVELEKEFPAELKAIDAAILRWRDEVEFALEYRYRVQFARARASAPPPGSVLSVKDLRIISRDELKDFFSQEYIRLVPHYPPSGTGKILKRRDAFLFTFDTSYEVLGITSFDAGWANGVSVVVQRGFSQSNGAPYSSTNVVAGLTGDGLRKYPDPAGPMPMPLFGNTAIGIRLFESEYQKAAGPGSLFFWAVKRVSPNRLIVVQRRGETDAEGKEQLDQQWEVTLWRDSKYPVIERSRFWYPREDGKLGWQGDTLYSDFRSAGKDLLFPTRVYSVRPLPFPPQFLRKAQGTNGLFQVQIWEATRYTPGPPPKDAFRIPLPPGMVVRGYALDPNTSVIDLFELTPAKLDGSARVTVSGRTRPGLGKTATFRLPRPQQNVRPPAQRRATTHRGLAVALALVGALLLVVAGFARSRRDATKSGANDRNASAPIP